MLKKPWYIIATNFALSALGIQTITLNSKWRQDNVQMAFEQGLTPKEAALVIYKLLPITQSTSVDRVLAEKTIAAWRASQSVRNEVFLLADMQAYPKSLHSPVKTPR
ncbi:hypothetical protein [Hydrogenophaga sp. 2FB]|uniref:hypothetical protein n=1 Tax=Hydrogenophaga sp. 2FB TaxID=2502187 RepID=UPI0010F6DE8D|nr:hypothetical protein [Hydrogenophaga sp. 2FB]